MSRAFSSGKLQGQERKEILQAVQQQAKLAACAAIKAILEAFAVSGSERQTGAGERGRPTGQF